MKNKLIDNAWKLNAKYLHSLPRFRNREIHHVFSRVGISKCCLALLVAAEPQHQLNWEWVKRLREHYRETHEIAKENFVRKLGCKRNVFPGFCPSCHMVKIYETPLQK